MILLFGLPLLSAYGRVVGAPFYFYPAILIIFLPLALIPASLGITITNLLMRFIPLSKAKSILLVIGLFIGALLVGLVRILSPQRLFSPSLISDFLKSLKTSPTPLTPYLPNYFATVSLTSCAQGKILPFFSHLLLLSLIAILFYLFSTFLGNRLFFSGLVHTQISSFRIGKKKRNFFLNSRLLPLSPFNQLIFKDIRLFIREITNWLPLLILFPIVIVHLINLKGLKIEEASLHLWLTTVNLLLVGFIITVASVRFIYPSLSLEGKSFWILRSAPISLRKIFFEKWLLTFIPLFIFCEALIIATNLLIRVEPFICILSIVTIFLLTATLTSLGIGMGGTFPKFRFDHPVYISTSAGGIFFMILCLFYVGMVIGLEMLFVLSPVEWSLAYKPVYLSYALITLGSILVSYFSLRIGYRSLLRYEVH
jgi:ABC-2 type transport system permease protein